MRRLLITAFCILLAACSSAQSIGDDVGEMSGNFDEEISSVLFVEPAGVKEQYATFLQRLKKIGSGGPGKRALYEQYVPTIGANGVLSGIEQLWPKCHSEGHDLGKVIFEKTKDIAVSLRVCRDGCYSGCMHGVLMEAFAGARGTDEEGHVDVEIVKGMMDEICSANPVMTASYSPGDCAHATGHALMVLADYFVKDAMDYCDSFTSPHMRYYCATGAYMEYVTKRDKEDAKTKRLFYTCDAYKYPAACARYKMVHVVRRSGVAPVAINALRIECGKLPEHERVGCFHGLGNALMSAIVAKKADLGAVCKDPDDSNRAACIDGAMERMAKYHPDRAREVCRKQVSGQDRDWCEEAVERGMYDMEKDLSLYL